MPPKNLEYFILDEDHQPVPADLMTWAQWFEHADNRIVAWTEITSEVTVSTIFLGIDHSWGFRGPRIMFETMVFGGPEDQYQARYSTWEDAAIGHERIVKKLRAKVPL